MILLFAKGNLARLIAVLAVTLSSALVLPGAVSAAIFMVDSPLDTDVGSFNVATHSDCTLRDAIKKANVDSGRDVILFDPNSLPLTIMLDKPLPAVKYPLTINASGDAVTVSGSPAYHTDYCPGSEYALDLTAPAASGSTVYGLPMYSLCDRAIRSNVQEPTISVGPRRFDGTLPVSGSSSGGDRVDLFFADDPATGEHEGDDFFYKAVATGGVYSFPPSPELTPGQTLTATASGPLGTSGFAQRVRVPDDIVSPTLVDAVAVGKSRVRLDFSETVAAGSAAPSEFSLSVGNLLRPVTAASPYGNSIFLDTSLPWQTGEAGSVATTGAGRVTDLTGNELFGQPAAPVFAGPGELDQPVIGSFRFSANRVCRRSPSAANAAPRSF
ncbi:MAG: hypothetical protein JJE27_02735 [Thermoleophilia bacterium]|nr:hypothetical protein [Thermoleophilia bacterium]